MPTEAASLLRSSGERIAFFFSQSCPRGMILNAQNWANARVREDPSLGLADADQIQSGAALLFDRAAGPLLPILKLAFPGANLQISDPRGSCALVLPRCLHFGTKLAPPRSHPSTTI
jgi:hypothetical protein